MKKKKILSVVLSAFLATGTVVPCFGATTQEKITDAKEQNAQTQSTLEETREKIQDLESKKGESETYLAELNGQLEELKDNLQQIQTDYDQKQEELVTLQQELEEAKQDEQEQYESMKVRIRYMYEKSTNSYLSLLFESDSIAEFLNQADYIAKITEYDRDMLEQYTQTKEEIAAKEEQVSQEKMKSKPSAGKCPAAGGSGELVESTYNQIRTYQEELAGAQSQESQLLTEIEQQNEEINSLLRQAKEEEAAAQLAAQKAAEEKAAQEAAAKEAQEEAARQAAEKAQQDTADTAEEETKGSSSQDSSSQNAASGSSSSSQKQETGTSSQENTSSDSSTQSSADTSQGKYLGRFKLTAYCTCSICCGSWAGGGTASGTTPTPGRTIAMGGVPFGTKLMINGTVYTVEDRGTAYGHVDILMGSHSQALQFGLQYADVYLVS